jgi:hypothetical protein
VCGAKVEVPAVDPVVIVAVVEENSSMQFVEVE